MTQQKFALAFSMSPSIVVFLIQGPQVLKTRTLQFGVYSSRND